MGEPCAHVRMRSRPLPPYFVLSCFRDPYVSSSTTVKITTTKLPNGRPPICSGGRCMNEQLPLRWLELNRIGEWIVNGPRSLVTAAEPGGGKAGWLDRDMHWSRKQFAGGMHETCTIYRRFEFEGASLPPYVVRFARWDKTKDQEACNAGSAQQISVVVQHYNLPQELMESISLLQERVAACAAAVFTPGPITWPDRTIVYRWNFPGLLLGQSLSWWSSSRSESLERLWHDAIPKETELEDFPGLIERFEVETLASTSTYRLSNWQQPTT
jgi:hypothetical protein